jgi:uncharacterized alkaline shock family protein YloU
MTSPAGGSRREDARRGTLTVAPRAVEKIAAAAAADVAAVGGPPPRVVRRRQRHRATQTGRPRVSARVGAGTARLSMSMSVAYPAPPVGETARQVRARVQERVAALAGLRVTHIDIDVHALRTRERTARVE